MKFGIDRLLADPALRAPLEGRRVALVAHPASVTGGLVHSLDALAACPGITLSAAFGPQHGLRGDKQDNMVETEDFIDQRLASFEILLDKVARTVNAGRERLNIGVARDETTFQPKQYVNKLPETLAGRQCIVLDPMLATGGSLAHTCQLLLERGATGTIIVVCVLAAPEGIAVLEQAGLDLDIYTAAVDERLNEHAFIVPGLGDAGDRQFGSPA
jgi:hypothetical protein